MDLSNLESVHSSAKMITDGFPTIQILINNSSCMDTISFGTDEWRIWKTFGYESFGSFPPHNVYSSITSKMGHAVGNYFSNWITNLFCNIIVFKQFPFVAE